MSLWSVALIAIEGPEASSQCEESHQQPRVEAFLYGGMGSNSSKPMCKTNQQLLQMFSCSYCCTRG